MYVYVYVCALACVRVYMYLHYIVSSCSMFDPTCDVFLFPTLHLSTQHQHLESRLFLPPEKFPIALLGSTLSAPLEGTATAILGSTLSAPFDGTRLHSFSPALLMLRTNWLRLRLQILSWVCSAVLTAHYN